MKYKFQEKSTPRYVWFLIFILVLIAVFGFLSGQQIKITPPLTTTTSTFTTTTPSPPLAIGDLIIAVKDVAQRVPRIGVVTALDITITKIEIHKAGENETNDTIGWSTIFEGTKTLDLIQFTDVVAIIGQKELEPGKYTQIRLILSNCSIKIYDAITPIYNKTFQLEVPSKELKLIHPFEVQANKTLVLTLDFDVPNSLDKDNVNKKYILKPTDKTVEILEESLAKGQKPEKSKIIE
jgi:hypothetical protein